MTSDVHFMLGLQTRTDLMQSLWFRIAVMQALNHAGKPFEAIEFARRHILDTLFADSIHMNRADIAVMNCDIAQVFLLIGDARSTAQYAGTALQYAQELRQECEHTAVDVIPISGDAVHIDYPAIHFWAQSLYACSKALTGELNDALHAVIDALRVSHEAAFKAQSWPLCLALQRVSTRMQRIQYEKMAKHFPQQSELPQDDFHNPEIVLSARRLVRAIRLLREHRYQELTSVMDAARGGTCSFSCFPVFYEMAIYLGSFALLQLNAPAAALNAVMSVEEREGRTLSFEPLKYSAYIALGNAETVLSATQDVLHRQDGASVASLILIYERRSIAFEMLGMHDQACIALSRSLHLSMDVGFISPSIGIPNSILSAIHERLNEQEPEFMAQVHEFVPSLDTSEVMREPEVQVINFTKRETIVSNYLMKGFTIKKMALTLFVSTNTIKSQVRSIYKKLGVSNRPEALEKIKEFRLSQDMANKSKSK